MIPTALKRAVSQVITGDKGHHSAAKAFEFLQRHRNMLRGLDANSLNRGELQESMLCLTNSTLLCQALVTEHPIVCLSWDATRLSGKETIWTALCFPATDHACFAPPQVLTLVCLVSA